MLIDQDTERCPFLATLFGLAARYGSQSKQLVIHEEFCALALHFSVNLGRGLASAGFFFASVSEMLLQLLFKAAELCWLKVLVDQFALSLLVLDHGSQHWL